MEDNIILKGEHLTKVYQSGKAEPFTALDDVTIGIKRAELTILKGRSGSGKTTLINMLSALDKPTSGTVVMDDVEISSLNTEKMEEFRRVHMGRAEYIHPTPRWDAFDPHFPGFQYTPGFPFQEAGFKQGDGVRDDVVIPALGSQPAAVCAAVFGVILIRQFFLGVRIAK